MRIALGFGALGALVWVAVELDDPHRIFTLLAAVPPQSIAAVVVLKTAQDLARALRLRLALSTVPPLRTLTCWSVVNIHQFLNLVLPARTGELSLVYLSVRHLGRSIGEAAGALAFIRLLDLLLLATFFSGGLFFFAAESEQREPLAGLGAAVAAVTLLLIFALPHGLRLAAIKLRSAIRWARLRALIVESDRYFRSRFSRSWLLKMFLLSTLQYLALLGIAWTAVHAVGFSLQAPAVAIGASGAIVTNLLPINPVGSLGTLEAGWTLGFVLAGLDIGAAIASGLFFHASVLGYAAVAAGLSYLALARLRG